jgi:hypothetical protein
MNPNTTISYMAAQAHHQQLERAAANGWLAQQAASQHGNRWLTAAATVKRVLATGFGHACPVVRETAPTATPAPRLNHVAQPAE